jgi:adenosylcobinamide-phosphate synthase
MTLYDVPAVPVLALALAIDLSLGDPPNAVHPVAWMGKLISALTVRSGSGRPGPEFIWGLLAALFVIALFAIPVAVGLDYLRDLSRLAYVVVGALLLKSSFSLRGLYRAAMKVRGLLVADRLDEARFEVRSLVGRDTARLDGRQIVSATVESVAENACDSFFAPLFFFLLLGVPGAVGYRVVNTLDNMIGHRGRYEYTGKFAARLDDVANFVPARITALGIVLAGWLNRKNGGGAWHTMLRDARNTSSPNAGWTMSAMAGALGVPLEKVGHYRVGDDASAGRLAPHAIDASLALLMTASLAWTLVVALAEVAYAATRW